MHYMTSAPETPRQSHSLSATTTSHRQTQLTAILVQVVLVLAATTYGDRLAQAADHQRPNILVFYVDDLRHNGLGATGHPFVETPNIDKRIAARGVVFRNSFVNCPLCSPSRASLMTGQFAATHGLTVNDDVNGVPDERLPYYQHALQATGYRTGLVGKWHMDSYFEPRPGFDYWAVFQGQGFHANPRLRIKKNSQPAYTTTETGFTTRILTDYALDFLSDHAAGKKERKPFALTLSFKAVHGPFGSTETESGDAYASQKIDRPPNALPTYGGFDLNQEKPVYSRPGFGGLTLNTTMGNAQQKSQMEMMRDIDAQIGRVLDELERNGLADNTLIIFTSDNGFFWGEHGRGDKRLVYEESIRVPLRIRGPGVQSGQTSDALVMNIDLAPTILTAAGLPVPAKMQGQPLNGLISGAEEFQRDSVYLEYYPEEKHPSIPRWDAVRTHTHLYVTHPEVGSEYDELYDLAGDPYQINNLLNPQSPQGLPPHAEKLLGRLRNKLQKHRKTANAVNSFTRHIVQGDKADCAITENGEVLRGSPLIRIGSLADGNAGSGGSSAYLVYQLPVIASPSRLQNAYVSFHVVSQTGNVSRVNADLWAIGISNDSTPLTEHLEADTEPDGPDRHDNVKIQDNIISLGNHLARTFSDDAASQRLASYLRDFYESNPDYSGGSYLQLRLNPDRDLGQSDVGWDISTIEAPTNDRDSRPFTFRQPALVLCVGNNDK